MLFDNRLALIAGTDIPCSELQLTIHQPIIREIALIGEIDFFTGIQCLSVSKNLVQQGETLLANINNFQIFMTIMTEKEQIQKKNAVDSVFQLIFPNKRILYTPRTLIITGDGENSQIDESNFEILQELIKEIFCLKSNLNSQIFNPADQKAKEIAEKIMRARQIVAKQKGEGEGSIFSQYVSSLTVAVPSMSLQDCLNLTMFQLFDLIERYSLYMSWDLDIRTRLAGGKPESKPENWMKNIH